MTLGFVLIGALICIAEPLAGMWGIIIGGHIGLFTFINSDEKKKKQKKYVSPNEAIITDSMIGCEEKNFNSIVMLFRGTGFTNVTAVPLKT